MNTAEHLLTCLAEEGVEVALEISKIASKTNRFGAKDRNFLNPTGPTNAERLVEELNDLIAVADRLAEQGVIPRNWFDLRMQRAKHARLCEMMALAIANKALQP